MERVHIIVYGTVQGVGFRFYTRDIALKTGITGWVKNLRDGSVEIVAEGSKEEIQIFLKRLQDGYLGRNISHIETKEEHYTGEFSSFDITF
ncbi:MAG: acylphosphatase [Candidatus Ratteibacteria bacterium]|nr:acylphosphatase [Candidatus Ratteibacteria bacterium]